MSCPLVLLLNILAGVCGDGRGVEGLGVPPVPQRSHGISEEHKLTRERADYSWRGRLTPSFAMRVSSVVGFMPSLSAAPPGPRIRQPVLSSTARMCSSSTSTSLGLQRDEAA